MRLQHQRGALGRTLPRAVSGLALALGLAAGPAQAVFVSTYNSGTVTPVPGPVLLPPGAFDGNYYRVAAPLAGGGVGVGAVAVSVTVPPGRLAAGGASGWIEPSFNYDGTVPPILGTTYYQTAFSLAGFNPATAAFSGRFATDDPLGKIYLNGVPLTAAGGTYAASAPNTWASFSFVGSSPFSNLVAGTNYLVFEVARSPSPVFVGSGGLRVEFSGDAQPVPEPSAFGMMALGLAGLAIARRKWGQGDDAAEQGRAS